jgi:hypothetical protein
MYAFLLFIPVALFAHRLPKWLNKLSVVCCTFGCVASISSVIFLLFVPSPVQLLMLIAVVAAVLYAWASYRFFKHCTRQAVLAT